MKYLVLVLFICGFACGCATTSKVSPRISTGMTKDEILRICGNPLSSEAQSDNSELLVYKESIYETPVGQWQTMNPADTLYTYITLENGKVARYITERVYYQRQPVSPQAQAAILGMMQQQQYQAPQPQKPKILTFGGDTYGYTKYDYDTGKHSSGTVTIREPGLQVINKE